MANHDYLEVFHADTQKIDYVLDEILFKQSW